MSLHLYIHHYVDSKTIYHAGFGPLMPGVAVVPFPYAVHGPITDEEHCAEWCLNEIKLALKQQTAPSETAAILIEPVLVRLLACIV
jgi:4-aminobutyrate aminotransferase